MKWLLGIPGLLAALAMIVVAAGISTPVQAVDPDMALLRLFPADAEGVLFVDLTAIRAVPGLSLGEFVENQAGAQLPGEIEEFKAATGIDPFEAVDQIMVGRTAPDGVLSAVRASYDVAAVEGYFQSREGAAESHGGRSLYQPDPDQDWWVAFAGDVTLMGPSHAVRDALDRMSGGPTALDNAELIAAIQSIEDGHQVWGVGSFDQAVLPDGIAPPMAVELIAALERGTFQIRVGDGVTARAFGEFATPETARRTGDLLRGVVALGKMQSVEQPEFIELLDGVQIANGGASVEIDFSATQDLLDRISEAGLLRR